MSSNKVVITGMGCISPIGNSIHDVWQSVLTGQSGIVKAEHPCVEHIRSKICGYVKDTSTFAVDKTLKKMDPFIQYGVWAADQCLKDANVQEGWCDPYRVGVMIGTGIGGLSNIEKNNIKAFEDPNRVSPFFIPATIPNMASGIVSIRHQLKGPNMAIASACASGTHAISNSAMMIETGLVDAMVVGGAEKASDLLGMSGFSAMRALSTCNDRPESASRPWDKGRDGFVLSDGAAVLLLESEAHALNRGAHIYAELVGYGFSSDANHITKPDETGNAAIYAIEMAIEKAAIDKEAIGYVNAHATSTPVGDVIEAKAIEKHFGSHIDSLLVSSTKSMHGHLLGAAGAFEAIISILALKHKTAPPTINLENIDFDTKLNFVVNKPSPLMSDYVLSNSFGFGGTNGTLIFKRAN